MVSVMAEGFEPIKTDDDVDEILKLAVRTSGSEGGDLRGRLQVSATELGISEEALAEAERQWLSNKKAELDRETENEDRKLFKKMQRGDFVSHFGTYLAVNAFLFWIDFRDGQLGWVYWVLFGWGIPIVIHLFTLFAHNAEQEREFQKWQKKRHKRRS